MNGELETQYMQQYGHGPADIKDVSVRDMEFKADEPVQGTVELPEGDYSLERRQTDFADGKSAVEYTIEGPEYISVQASLGPEESFGSTDNYEVASTVGDLSKDEVKGLWNNLRTLEQDDLLSGFSRID